MDYEKDRLSDTERKVLEFIREQMAGESTISSEGLMSLSIAMKVVNSASSWYSSVSKLKYQKYMESIRDGQMALYSITDKGYRELNDQTELEPVKAEAKPMNRPMEDALKEALNKGKFNYTATSQLGLSLPKPGTYAENVNGIIDMFKERINPKAGENEVMRLREWYDKLSAQGVPAYQWMVEAIANCSTKVNASQRTIAYLIGILKSWATYGFGSDYSSEAKKLFERFESRFNTQLSDAARRHLMGIIERNGIVDTLAGIFEMELEIVDMSRIIVEQLERSLGSEESA